MPCIPASRTESASPPWTKVTSTSPVRNRARFSTEPTVLRSSTVPP